VLEAVLGAVKVIVSVVPIATLYVPAAGTVVHVPPIVTVAEQEQEVITTRLLSTLVIWYCPLTIGTETPLTVTHRRVQPCGAVTGKLTVAPG